jgi:hypothetical protein
MFDFCIVKNLKPFTLAALVGGGYFIFRGLQKKRSAENLFFNPVEVKFSLNRAERKGIIYVALEIQNPVGETLSVNRIYGTVTDQNNNELGYFQTGKITLKPGRNVVTIAINLATVGVFFALTEALSTNRWPKIRINFTTVLAGGLIPVKEFIEFNTADIKNAVTWR